MKYLSSNKEERIKINREISGKILEYKHIPLFYSDSFQNSKLKQIIKLKQEESFDFVNGNLSVYQMSGCDYLIYSFSKRLFVNFR